MNIFSVALREIKNNPWQLVLFGFCVILSISSFIALEGFNENVNSIVERDTKELAGGDIVVESNRIYSQGLQDKLKQLENRYELTNIYEFNSIIYNEKSNLSNLAEVKIVGDKYPLYGEFELQSGRDFDSLEKTGIVIVEQDVLNTLNVSVGEFIQVGDTKLKIEDVIVNEPDRSLNFFTLGPRVLLFENDLKTTGLVTDRSRVDFETYIKVPENDISQVVEEIDSFKSQRERVEVSNEETSDISQFITVFLDFITLILFFTILLAGIGISTTLYTFIDGKKKSIAIMKAFGEKNGKITRIYLLIAVIVGLVATVIGIVIGLLMQFYLPEIFSNIIPEDIEFAISALAITKGVILSAIIIILFSIFPLISLRKIKPLQILRDMEISVKNQKENILFGILLLVFLVTLIAVEFEDLTIGIVFTLGFFGLFGIIYALEYIIFYFLKQFRLNIKSLALKTAISGLFRPGSKSLLFVTTIATSLSIIFTISLIELNVEEQFVASYPEDAPNVFFIDIKKDQLNEFESSVGKDLTFYPVIRGPIITYNDESIGDVQKRLGPGEPVTREFSLTYYENDFDLLPGERFVEASIDNSLFVENWEKDIEQVSVLTEISNRMKIKIGDRLTFLVQGIEIEAEVVSIRERTTNDFNPFFYFVFEREALLNAPQALFTTTNFPQDEISELQNRIAREFPQITTIDVSKTAKQISDLLNELSSVVKFFTAFSLIAGFLILVSSLVSTSRVRLQEIVYFKLVGTSRLQILKTVFLEYLVIGLLSSVIGIILSTLTTFVLIKFFLELDYVFLMYESILYIIITTLIIVILGLLGTVGLFKKKPIEFIRKHTVE